MNSTTTSTKALVALLVGAVVTAYNAGFGDGSWSGADTIMAGGLLLGAVAVWLVPNKPKP